MEIPKYLNKIKNSNNCNNNAIDNILNIMNIVYIFMSQIHKNGARSSFNVDAKI